jgi:hypothetical protein
MRKIKMAAIAGTLGIALVGGGVVVGANAEAGALTNTTVTTNTLVSAKCYKHVSTSTTMFHWDSKLGKYTAYPSAHHSTSSYVKCHV